MHPPDRYGPHDEGRAELPELPIPRPGEWSPLGAGTPAPIAPPSLGGGASFTSVSDDERQESDPHESDPALRDLDQLTWEVAARLTSGMLANPGRSHASVKDAMGLFDQFLHEMHAYVRIASDYDLLGDEAARRKARGEYFRGAPEGAAESSAELPINVTPRVPITPPKPAPAQPRPSDDYRPIPPGARAPYAPGSMAGTPPPAEDEDTGRTAA